MSIPDPTIDPITGLPILDTSGIVEQIPLGNQIVDYSGWNASAQPTRGPLYPDDVIPTFANVSGQHPGTSNAQSIQSDGNHALKVSVVNAASGGVSAPVIFVATNQGYQTTVLNTLTPTTTWNQSDYKTMLGYHVSVWWMSAGGGTGPPGWLTFRIHGNGGGGQQNFVSFPAIDQAVVMNNPVSMTAGAMFPGGMNLNTLFPGSTTFSYELFNYPSMPVKWGYSAEVYLGA